MGRRQTNVTTSLPRLHLAMADPGFRLWAVTQWVLGLVIIVALGLVGWFWSSSRLLEGEAGGFERAAARLQELNRQFERQASEAGFAVSEERTNALGREVAFAGQLLGKRSFSWTRMLSDLEEAVPPRISVGAVTLSFTDDVITLNGASSTLKDLTAFLNELEGHGAFHDAVLLHHRSREPKPGAAGPASRRADAADRGRTVEFTLTVGYRPPH